MSTTHHRPDLTRLLRSRPARCFRHRVWMAACVDCRDAHRELLGTGRPAEDRTPAGE